MRPCFQIGTHAAMFSNRNHDTFGIALVDRLLEETRLALEENNFKMNQRRLSYTKFIGEL